MNRSALLTLTACLMLLAGCAMAPSVTDRLVLEKQVADTERAFAKSMADRDLAAFTAFLSEETIFASGPAPMRGKKQVAESWKRFFEDAAAPFSWEPERVLVLDSGTLALSTGPVHDPDGKLIATFFSIWRLEAPGTWHIIFDSGTSACNCDEAKKAH